MRQNGWYLLLLTAFALLPLTVSGETMTATVTSYNAVEMSGDIPAELWYTFNNENHSKGQVTTGKTATLTIGGWPNCRVTGLTVYLHSNTSGGAGTFTLLVDDQIRASVSGSMLDLVGAYSTETVPFEIQGDWHIYYDQTVCLMLTGTENSLYIESVQIDYQIAPDEPYCLTLNYSTETRFEALERCEEGIATGIVLPEVDNLTDSTAEWVFAGWSPVKVFTSAKPELYPAGTTVYPRHDDQLWAVYCTGVAQSAIPQCTERTPKEVVIVKRNDDMADLHLPHYMMTGPVVDDVVRTDEPIIDTTDDGTAYLLADYMPYSYRYRIEWRHHDDGTDSARIYHPATGTYIGWSGAKLEANENWWQVGYAGRSSVYFYHDVNASSQARMLWESQQYDHYSETYTHVFTTLFVKLTTVLEGLLLFDVSELPTASPTIYWSSNPFGIVGLTEMMRENASGRAVKRLCNGQIVIVRDDAMYTLTGLRIR